MVTRLGAMALAVPVGAALVVAGALGAGAQVDPLDPLGTTTTTAPKASTTTTTAAPMLANPLKPKPAPPKPAPPKPAPAPAPAPAPPAAPPPAPAPAVPVPDNGGGEGVTPPPDAGPFPEELAKLMRSVKRTRPNNSNALVDALKALTDLGMPLDEAMRVGMGRFPVAGRASYSHDWWYPRFGPGWRLHEGTDLFAAQGTPLRSPTEGVVRFGNGGLGGISTYVVQSDGTYFYFAHLEGRPTELKDGQSVRTGDIIGFNGSSGNAAGGSPHLHFEVHPAVRTVTVGKGKKATTKVVHHPVRPGTVLPAMDPKPLLDLYLKEAMEQLPAIVAAYQASRPPPAPVATDGTAVPTGAVAVPGQQLAAAAGLVPTEPPLARAPLLALAFLLVMMVGVLTPVLAPRRRLVGGPPLPASPADEKKKRRRRRAPPPPPAAPPPSGEDEEPPSRPRTRVRGRVRKARKPRKASATVLPGRESLSRLVPRPPSSPGRRRVRVRKPRKAATPVL